jgi:hypothetical protein
MPMGKLVMQQAYITLTIPYQDRCEELEDWTHVFAITSSDMQPELEQARELFLRQTYELHATENDYRYLDKHTIEMKCAGTSSTMAGTRFIFDRQHLQDVRQHRWYWLGTPESGCVCTGDAGHTGTLAHYLRMRTGADLEWTRSAPQYFGSGGNHDYRLCNLWVCMSCRRETCAYSANFCRKKGEPYTTNCRLPLHAVVTAPLLAHAQSMPPVLHLDKQL